MDKLEITVDELTSLLTSAARKGFTQGQRKPGQRKMGDVILSCEQVSAGLVGTHKVGRHELPST